jgi:hypothetical protein
MRVAPIVLAVTLVSGACKKDSVPAGVLTPEVEALLAHVPADSKTVAGMDVAAARKSAVWDKLIAPVLPGLFAGHHCVTSLVGEIDRLVIASPDQNPDIARTRLIAVGRFTASGKSCLTEIASLREGKTTWLAADTAVIGPDAATAAPVTGSAEMMAVIRKANSSGLVWVAADTRGAAASAPFPMPAEVHGFTISILPSGDGVSAIANLQLDSEERAESTADMFRDQKATFEKGMPDPKLGKMIGRLSVSQAGKEVAFQVGLSAADIEHLVSMKAMLGAGL